MADRNASLGEEPREGKGMNDTIYLIQDDGSFQEIVETPYPSEDVLQRLLAEHPAMLRGGRTGTTGAQPWLLVAREIPVPDSEIGDRSFFLDHLFLDQDGVPTLVEVKRSSDTRIRREVVGQMLDYAANAVTYLPVHSLQALFEETCSTRGEDAAVVLRGFLEVDPTVEVASEEFWQKVKTNLQAGRVRMIFVADDIPARLKRIIEFLNVQMDPAEVLGIELRQFVGEGVRTIVPHVIGQTAEAETRKAVGASQKNKWDEPSLLQALGERNNAGSAAVARAIIDWARGRGLGLWWGEGLKDGSFYPMLELEDGQRWVFSVWTNGKVEIHLQSLRHYRPFDEPDMRRELLRRLNEILGVDLPLDAIDRRPRFPILALGESAKLQRFLSIMDWAMEQLRTHAGK